MFQNKLFFSTERVDLFEIGIVSDYAIAGTMIEPGRCWFQYKSLNLRQGWTNSPFFANTYPANTNCIYVFLPEAKETVRLAFTMFQTAEVDLTGNRYHKPMQTCKKVSYQLKIIPFMIIKIVQL